MKEIGLTNEEAVKYKEMDITEIIKEVSERNPGIYEGSIIEAAQWIKNKALSHKVKE